MRNLFLILTIAFTTVVASRAALETYDFSGIGLAIPDGNAAGVTDFRTLSSSITFIQSVTVGLNISGDFNGDLYGYLQHSSGFTVLLNRVGRTGLNPAGYSDSGFNITLSDAAINDIHNYQSFTVPATGSPLTGSWQPDARSADPAVSLNTSPRDATFSSFNGLNANGDWALFLADMEFGGTSTLNSWSLQITGVPEPVEIALLVFGFAFAAVESARSRKVRGFLRRLQALFESRY